MIENNRYRTRQLQREVKQSRSPEKRIVYFFNVIMRGVRIDLRRAILFTRHRCECQTYAALSSNWHVN